MIRYIVTLVSQSHFVIISLFVQKKERKGALNLSVFLSTAFLNDNSYYFCKQVKIEALNDSRQIGMCVYNVFVLSAVGLMFSLLLEEKVVEMYGITSGCVIIGTTLTQAIVFVPKVK